MATLRPVSGTPGEVLGLLRDWQAAADPDPLLVATSGSTGTPKRVLLSRAAMTASATATHRRLGGPGQWLLALPATYVAGLQVLFRSVLAGADPVLWSLRSDPFAEAAAAMTGVRRYVSLVPTQLIRLLESPAGAEALRGFDSVLVGGARVAPWLRTVAADAGVHVVTTYGMSETCGGCVYDGRALDGVRVAIDDEERIRITGPVLFDGYDAAPGKTAEVMQQGWFVTSDLGRIDQDGTLHVLGRVDDVIVSGGVNVPAAAVAERLREHPAVDEAEVVGLPDAEWGEKVVAVVVGALELDEARDWVSVVHPRTWAPRDIRHLDDIPLLDNGKVDRVTVERAAR